MVSVEPWVVELGLLNVILFIFCLVVIFPRGWLSRFRSNTRYIVVGQLPMIGLIVAVVALQLFEVRVLDPLATSLVGMDFTPLFVSLEDGVGRWFIQNWNPTLLTIFVYIYIGIYPFLLWFTPLYFVLTNQRRAMTMFAVGLLLIYVVALPFYLFFPVTNVYTYFHEPSALNTVIPSVERFFYTTTTSNNCFPSLHVAMALLIAFSVSLTRNRRFRIFTAALAVGVIISVIYLGIHWITDVIGGAILSVSVFLLLRHATRGPHDTTES